jgi:hypothetical protein
MQVKMTIDEALEYADEWAQETTFHEESQGWRVVCAILALEVRQLRDAKSLGFRRDSTGESEEENLTLNQQLLNVVRESDELEKKLNNLLLQNELQKKRIAKERGSK